MAYIWIWATLCRNVKQKANKIETGMGRSAPVALFLSAGLDARGGEGRAGELFPISKQPLRVILASLMGEGR